MEKYQVYTKRETDRQRLKDKREMDRQAERQTDTKRHTDIHRKPCRIIRSHQLTLIGCLLNRT